MGTTNGDLRKTKETEQVVKGRKQICEKRLITGRPYSRSTLPDIHFTMRNVCFPFVYNIVLYSLPSFL